MKKKPVIWKITGHDTSETVIQKTCIQNTDKLRYEFEEDTRRWFFSINYCFEIISMIPINLKGKNHLPSSVFLIEPIS